ncbi:MAG: tetratricopeptide repeat protein [Chloroflexi bacterium]|nr:tetratricopeptide repeat protein [Chloroflexota bacterium]
MSAAADSDWVAYRRAGAALYGTVRAGRGRLQAAIELVGGLRSQPLELKRELPQILLLLEGALDYPELHEPTIQLVLLLEPWAEAMADWQRWERVLGLAAVAAARLGQWQACAVFRRALAAIFMHTGRVDSALAAMMMALETARRSGSPVLIARAVTGAVDIMMKQGTVDRARELLLSVENDPVVVAAEGVDRADAWGHLDLALANVSRRAGLLEQAVIYADRAVRRLDDYPDTDPHLRALAYRVRGVFEWAKGLNDDALRDLREAARLYTRLGDPFGRALALGNLGLVYRTTGELDAAETATRRAVQAARQMNLAWLLTREIGNLGLVSLFQGRLKEAERLVNRHLKLASRLGIESEVGRAKGNLGVIKLHQGQYETARDLLEWDRAVSEAKGLLEGLAVVCTNLGRCYGCLGDGKRALDEAERALALARQLGSRALEIMALRVLAECVPPERGKSLLRRAHGLAEGRRFDRAACLLALAALEDDTSRRARLWEVGRRHLVLMGAGTWLSGHSPEDPPRLPALV